MLKSAPTFSSEEDRLAHFDARLTELEARVAVLERATAASPLQRRGKDMS